MRRGIVTGGTWCVDRNKLVDFWPAEEEVSEILAVEMQGGGPGCNLAIDMKRLDPSFPIATIGLVGDDDDGRFLSPRPMRTASTVGSLPRSPAPPPTSPMLTARNAPVAGPTSISKASARF